MAGFYNVPFTSVAPKSAETAANLVKDSFMDVAKCIRARIYAFMNVPPESCEVLKVGENKKLDKILEEYLKCYKNMGKSNVSRSCCLFTLILRCPKFCKIRFFFTLIRILELTGTPQTEVRCKVQYAMLECGTKGGEKTQRKPLFLPVAEVQYSRGRNIPEFDRLRDRETEVEGAQQ